MKYNFIYIRDISIPNNKVDHVKNFYYNMKMKKVIYFQ